MSEVTDLHHSQVGRIWKAHRLKPHRVRYFKLSTDPKFVEKIRDVVGLYEPEKVGAFEALGIERRLLGRGTSRPLGSAQRARPIHRGRGPSSAP